MMSGLLRDFMLTLRGPWAQQPAVVQGFHPVVEAAESEEALVLGVYPQNELHISFSG